MKKVLFIVNTMGQAGAETALIALLRKMLKTGEFDISLYAMIPRGEMFKKVPRQVHFLNRRYSNGSVLSAGGRMMIFLRIIRAFFYRMTGFRMLGYLLANIKLQKAKGRVQYDKVFWRLLAQGTPALADEYDLAVAYIEGASAYYLADHVRAKRKAAFIHIDYIAAGYHPMMDQGCYDPVERIFVVSNEVGKKFLEVYPQYEGKVTLFRNIVDRDLVSMRAKTGEGFTDGYTGKRLVTVGRLARQKGYDLAVPAMAKLVRDGYDARWYVVGEGPERKALEQLIEKHGLQERFILMGAKDNPYPYMLEADLYVQPSRFEGCPLTVEEALILGKPILASDCTGIAEQIVSGQNGVLFTLSTEELADKLEWLLDNPQRVAAISEGTRIDLRGKQDGWASFLRLMD